MERKEKDGQKGIQNGNMVTEGPGVGMENTEKIRVGQEADFPGDGSNAAGVGGKKHRPAADTIGSKPLDSDKLNTGDKNNNE